MAFEEDQVFDSDASTLAVAPQSRNIFEDLDSLRLSPESAASSVREVMTHVPIRKPGRSEFVRVHPDPAMTLTTSVYMDKEERETFFVFPGMRDALVGEMRPALLLLGITRQGVIFIWPLALPLDGGRPSPWYETARQGAELAKAHWVRVAADMSLGAYRLYQAEADLSEPTWPTKSLSELLTVAFKDRVIDRGDHPVVRKLRGLT